MAVLFKGQDYRLTLDTGLVLTTATVTKILYQKPSGAKGGWVATISGTTIYYDVIPTDNSEYGVWIFQSYVEMGGKKYFGEEVIKEILNNLN